MNKLKTLIILCVLSASVAINAHAKVANKPPATKIELYELYLDFGNDFVFLHEVTRDKLHCKFRATIINIKDNVKTYCMKREF